MAVTGVASDEGRGDLVVEKLRQASTVPVYVGIGITTPHQAAAACTFADGAIVGSALVQRLLDGEGPRGVELFLGEMRSAINAIG
jgi:tryptophan synthase alpha chain